MSGHIRTAGRRWAGTAIRLGRPPGVSSEFRRPTPTPPRCFCLPSRPGRKSRKPGGPDAAPLPCGPAPTYAAQARPQTPAPFSKRQRRDREGRGRQDSVVTGLSPPSSAVAMSCWKCPCDRQDLAGPPLAAAVDLETRRVPFTPDLLPSDATGPLVLNPGTSKFSFQPNPMLANSMLADETNSAPFKTPASLWTRWREAGHRRRDGPPPPRPLPGHGGQDPMEHECTCPLPQAPLGRPPGVGRLAPAQGRRERTALSHAQGYDPRDLPATGPLPVGCPSS
ncbi:AAA family ATPase [Streptomyces diastaticus]|uniref:AAA family ATPase n=1 Tax=Streptomyces diastaticus TaxID=1956 RepID=UPI0035D72DCB